MMGFIPSDQYDEKLKGEENTIWQSTWMVVRSEQTRGLGKKLLEYALKTHKWGWTGTCGLDHGTRPIYEKLGYRTGLIEQYYLINPTKKHFNLALVPKGTKLGEGKGNGTLTLLNKTTFTDATKGLGLDRSSLVPKKSCQQFLNRFLLHPFYKYQVYLARKDDFTALLATRICTHEESCALRVVDFHGDPRALAESSQALQSLMIETGAEYLDFYCSGMKKELAVSGLCNVRESPGLIVPNHFEPFEQVNKVLLFALKGPGDQIVVCKGDGDQDRTNLIPERV